MADISHLKKLCQKVRYDILTSTTAAKSGHPSSSLSAVELMTTLFFGEYLQTDITNPQSSNNDRVIFSKGHSAPLLYSLYHAADAITTDELMGLRKMGSKLEGHPTPNFPYTDFATGSLGQGLSLGVGLCLSYGVKYSQHKTPKVYVLLGDSELSEGQNWEAIQIATHYQLNNLIAILDVNRLGQTGETMLGWDLPAYQKRFAAFGWRTIVIQNGNDVEHVCSALNALYEQIDREPHQPTVIIAKTNKGHGVTLLENQENWHGKTLNEEQMKLAIRELGPIDLELKGKIKKPNILNIDHINSYPDYQLLLPNYLLPVSTRIAYGDSLVKQAAINKNIVVLDAEVSNSTFTDQFKKTYPTRFFEMFIAEQNMVTTAVGMSKLGLVPFVSTFAAFLTRGYDQIRMAQYSAVMPKNPLQSILSRLKQVNVNKKTSTNSHLNLKIVGSHAGVSIGADGASQMGLEDLAMMRSIQNCVVFYPSDAVSAFKLTVLMADNPGIFYLRTTREKTPVIYNAHEEFKIGGCKIHRANDKLQISNNKLQTLKSKRILIIAAGITLHEALKAQKKLTENNINAVVIDLYSVKPIDSETILKLAKETDNIVVVEDHYEAGGIGEAVLSVFATNPLTNIPLSPYFRFTHLCVRKIPHSGSMAELLHYEEIDADAIIEAVTNSSA